MMKHKRAYLLTGIFLTLASAAAAAIWHFVWLKDYEVTPTQLQERYAYKAAIIPRQGYSAEIRLKSFDDTFIWGRVVYPSDPALASKPFPVLIGLHAMGRSHQRWFQPDINGRPTREQTDRITEMALQQGFAVVAIDAREHGIHRHIGQQTPVRGIMRSMEWFGRRQPYEEMNINTVRDQRVLLDWLVAQPHVDSTRIVAAGYSMGAQGALILAGLDERVRAVMAMVPPHLGNNVALVAPINFVAGLAGKRVWLLTADDDDHATAAQNQALFEAIPTQDKKHFRFDSGHLLPPDYVEKLTDWFKG